MAQKLFHFSVFRRSLYSLIEPISVMQPVTPHFKTDIRAQHTCRPLPLSYEEQEEALLLEMQSHSFKAKPVNKRIFQSMGELGEDAMCTLLYVCVCVSVCVYLYLGLSVTHMLYVIIQ
jgi:hypothetical protein